MATENNAADNAPHKTVIATIIEKIEDVIENMDSDFPLSGGVEHPVNHHDHIDAEPAEKQHITTSFPKDVNTEFPLSGGEVER